MKKILFVLAITLALGSFLAMSSSAEEKTVNASITPLVISMSLSTNVLNYGTRQANIGEVVANPESITVTNTGTVAQNFQIKGADSAEWTLATSPGTNQFVHRFSTNNSNFSDLTTNYAALQSGVAASGNFSLFMRMVVPTTITQTAVQTLPIKVLAIQQP